MQYQQSDHIAAISSPITGGEIRVGYAQNFLVPPDETHNQFHVTDLPGPYLLTLSDTPQNILLHVASKTAPGTHEFRLSKNAYLPRLRERLAHVVENEALIRSGTNEQIEASELTRRKNHNENAQHLLDRLLETGITPSFETARNLFATIAETYAPTLAATPYTGRA